MIAHHIHHALAQVRALKLQVLDRQRFMGYSGRARLLSGVTALAAAMTIASPRFVTGEAPVLGVWLGLFAAAVVLNYGALLYWFLYDPSVKRDWRKLRPTLDVFPPLVVGGLITLALLRHGHYELLYGTWMCCYGLANLASRHVLPPALGLVGVFYLLAGGSCLFWPGLEFANPWPMGLAFFVGEVTAGAILHFDQRRRLGRGPEPDSARRTGVIGEDLR